MDIQTVAILSPGEMGAAVGKAFASNGFNVITTLEGRSRPTQERALTSGFDDGGSLKDVIAAADIVLSILPPAAAPAQAEAVASAMRDTGKTPPYADCNAVAPEQRYGLRRSSPVPVLTSLMVALSETRPASLSRHGSMSAVRAPMP